MLRALLAIHVAGGSAALASMLIPLLVRKGGAVHRRAGWVFVGGMTIVAVTALMLSAARFLLDPTPDGQAGGVFLFYIAILTGAGVSAGMRVLRAKGRRGRHRHPWDLALPLVLVASAGGIAVYGVASGRTLFAAFSVIGIVTGGSQLAYWLRPPTHPMHWWFEHMGNMLGACIAATTAFLVNNAGTLGMPSSSLLIWLAPAAVGVPMTIIWTRYYRRRFDGRRSVRAPQDGRSTAAAV
jgi:hypothetical protein